uniref:Tetratricopeptide repeat-containing protein n=1 Tax=Neospora caninum (strain Liverpool) TaxID=572307 RepID=A0A0F7UNN0_NEOCL|nr:TPA: tetratricopeptide repeat-containing protein [Neospora caninum Liverpool]
MPAFSVCCEKPCASPCEHEREVKPCSVSDLFAPSENPVHEKREDGNLVREAAPLCSDSREEERSDVDVALEALRFSVCTKAAQRREGGDQSSTAEAAGDNERRLQKVVDKQEFSGEDVLPLEEFLQISNGRTDEVRERLTRTDIYRYGRVPWRGHTQPSSPPSESAASPSASAPEEIRDVFVLDGVFSTAECEWLRRRVEEGPTFTYWDSTGTANSKYRSAYTVEIHHPGLADVIWERIKDWVIREVTIEKDDEERGERDLVGDWIACGVNPHLLFARYTDGAHFGPHTDGYGGETLVVDNVQKTQPMAVDEAGRHTADPQLIVDSVEALAGRMLFFYHTQMHEGRRVGPGASKFIIRTDVLYRRKIPLLTTPKDQEAFALWQRAELLAEEGQADEAAVLFRRSVKLSPDLAAIYGMA